MNDQTKHWLVRAKTIRLLWIGFISVLALTVVADFFVHRHVYFGIDGWFGFFAWFGFLTCVAMIVGAKILAVVLKRPDTYYDE